MDLEIQSFPVGKKNTPRSEDVMLKYCCLFTNRILEKLMLALLQKAERATVKCEAD